MKIKIPVENLITCAILFGLVCAPAHAFLEGQATKVIIKVGSLISHPNAVPSEEIARLASLGNKTGGTKEIGQILGRRNLPPSVLEDAYMRIAIQQEKITRLEAEGMMIRLNGTPGFRSTISKIVGNSDVKTSGHLHELRIADNAAQNGYKVKGIGETFNDGKKISSTDIDILLEKNGRVVAIEAKNYSPNTPIPMDKFRADMDSLVEYAKRNPSGRVLNIFSVANKPGDEQAWKLLNLEAERRGVQLIEGSPEQQIILIERLLKEAI